MATIVAFLSSLFTAIAGVKALAGYVDTFATTVIAWYAQNASNKQKMDMADALILFANASNDDDAFAAEAKVKEAVQRARYL